MIELHISHYVFLGVRQCPFPWFQGQGHLFKSRSVIKVFFLQKLPVTGAWVFHKQSLLVRVVTSSAVFGENPRYCYSLGNRRRHHAKSDILSYLYHYLYILETQNIFSLQKRGDYVQTREITLNSLLQES